VGVHSKVKALTYFFVDKHLKQESQTAIHIDEHACKWMVGHKSSPAGMLVALTNDL